MAIFRQPYIPTQKRKSSLPLIASLLILTVLTFAASAYAGYRIAEWRSGGNPVAVQSQQVQAPPQGAPLDGGSDVAQTALETILLIGVDQRTPDEPCRSDTIMLATLDPEKHGVDILSIPRDSRVTIPGRGLDKINAAHAYGGPRLLMDTINSFLGTHVDKYVEVNFQGFQKIVDVLGGVDIDVDKRMYYPEENIDLKPGFQHLNGYDTLAYVRYRYDPEGDITRIGRQQKFMKAVIDQTLKLSTVPKIPKLVAEISKNVKTNLSLKEMLSLALGLKDLSNGAVEAYTIPGEGKYLGGVSYFVVDQRKLPGVLAAISNLR